MPRRGLHLERALGRPAAPGWSSGSCTPRPRKLRKLSNRITCGTVSVAYTITGPSTFGTMWRAMMRCAGSAERDGRLDELALPQRERLAAHDARHGEPADRADGEEDQQQAATEHHGQDDHEEHVRQRIQHVDDAHHPAVDAPAEVAGGGAPGNADHDADGGGEQRDEQRYPRAATTRARTGRGRCRPCRTSGAFAIDGGDASGFNVQSTWSTA